MLRSRSSRHELIDGAEDTPLARVEHLDADAVAGLHERGLGGAKLDCFSRASLHQARTAPFGELVRDRAAAENGAGGERARLADVLDQLEERKMHFRSRIDVPHDFAVVRGAEPQMHTPVV